MEGSVVSYLGSQATCLGRQVDGYGEAAVFSWLNGSKADHSLDVAWKQGPRPGAGAKRDGGVAEKGVNGAGVANHEARVALAVDGRHRACAQIERSRTGGRRNVDKNLKLEFDLHARLGVGHFYVRLQDEKGIALTFLERRSGPLNFEDLFPMRRDQPHRWEDNEIGIGWGVMLLSVFTQLDPVDRKLNGSVRGAVIVNDDLRGTVLAA